MARARRAGTAPADVSDELEFKAILRQVRAVDSDACDEAIERPQHSDRVLPQVTKAAEDARRTADGRAGGTRLAGER